MDWFERLTGFREGAYDETRAKLEVQGNQLHSRVNQRIYQIGRLELVSLAELRMRVVPDRPERRISVRNVVGGVGGLHRAREHRGALFQVASQFNLLEMIGPSVSPEHGVSRYAFDPTQGPACAIAAGAATIYRNYFAPVGDQLGQTSSRQLDGLADLGTALAGALGRPVSSLWDMRNGYALCHSDGLSAITSHLNRLSEGEIDQLRARLRIGLHSDVEVTDGAGEPPNAVTQAFCSALPVAYRREIPRHDWAALATLVLEAAYEATLLAARKNVALGGPNLVFLTRLGGGAFGNDEAWIDTAMLRAIRLVEDQDLDVRLVSYREVPASMRAIEQAFS